MPQQLRALMVLPFPAAGLLSGHGPSSIRARRTNVSPRPRSPSPPGSTWLRWS